MLVSAVQALRRPGCPWPNNRYAEISESKYNMAVTRLDIQQESARRALVYPTMKNTLIILASILAPLVAAHCKLFIPLVGWTKPKPKQTHSLTSLKTV
jgi:hypothetical protein